MHEILAALDFGRLDVGEGEAQFAQCQDCMEIVFNVAPDKASASCVVSGKPRRIAPDFPRNRYRTPCRAKA
ncbi:MAG TPA: hypothetical protein VHV77_17645, partial [Pirellulales bacterium]|nr:hypothetical protein [Pirellulales bacterium]